MADKMDKALTQEPRKELNIPGQEEIQESVEQEITVEESKKGPVEIQEEDDGSVTVDFDPNAASPEGGDEHYANLAEFLEDHVLDELGSDLTQKYMDYNMSRKDWEKTYTQGLDLLGFKYDMRTEPFQGASGATHPVCHTVSSFSLQRIITSFWSCENTSHWCSNSRKATAVRTCKRLYEL